ncbi:MAG: DNA-binding response regulator [Deltaproteobacteria bacterium]|nr:MAG: DNA-binding response regulator [Deltaproteobacteria bacterium]
MRILLADDHALFRSSLRLHLETHPELEVVAEAADCESVLQHARRTQPDVILLDLAMPGGDALDVIPRLREACPASRILVVTAFASPTYLRRSLSAGASGYVCKATSPEQLLAAVRAVREGKTYISLSETESGAALGTGSTRVPAVGPELSGRERQVLELIAYGHTYKEIASELGVSIKTVETYRSRLSEKLGLRSRSDIVRYALDHNILRA